MARPELYKHDQPGVTILTMVQVMLRALTYCGLVVLWPYLAYQGLDRLELSDLYVCGLLAFTGLICAV